MKIIIKRLAIKNFKGIKSLDLDFGTKTNVYGENGIGKTTIQDGFTFLLFDKDSKDSTKFDVQPLDAENNPIHNLETSIKATLEVDGKVVELERIYKEKYSKVRGTGKEEFKGYESSYYVNEVPKKVTEYKAFINELLQEEIFKMVTNPLYFASKLWKERRAVLMDIIGDIDAEIVVNYKEDLKPLEDKLEDMSIDDFMKANRNKINKLKKDREQIPSRVDEVHSSIKEIDFDALEFQRKGVTASIKKIDAELIDKSKSNEGLFQLKQQLLEKRHKLTELEYAIKSESNKPKQELEGKIRGVESNIRLYERDIERLQSDIGREQSYIDNVLEEQRTSLLKTYSSIKAMQFEFDEENCKCPMCDRKYETDDIEKKRLEREEKFNLDKASRLKKNVEEGKAVKIEKDKLEKKIQQMNSDLENRKELLESTKKSREALNSKLKSIGEVSLGDDFRVKEVREDIKKLMLDIENFKAFDDSELKSKKQELEAQLREIDKQLAYKETNVRAKDRIDELEKEEQLICEKIAELEGLEMLSEEFIRTKVELLEERVNSKFNLVKFKMFKSQINGGLEECCEPMINGVPFSSNLNSAAKINAGLDIINTLSKHYNVNAPIFIDNRESTNEIIPVESQVINLIVSKDKEFRVEVVE